MQLMCDQVRAPAEWAVFHGLCGVLRRFGAIDASRQEAGRINAFGYRTDRRESWPGQRVGVRPPEAGETALSAAEVPYLLGLAGKVSA